MYGRSYWGNHEFIVIDTGGVMTISKSQDDVMEELAITKTIGMDGIPLASREAAVARMPSMIERQAATAVEEASVIIFLVDGQVIIISYFCKSHPIILCVIHEMQFFAHVIVYVCITKNNHLYC